MKKILGISLVAVLVATPMMAGATVGVTPVATGETPAHYEGNDPASVTATTNPKFDLIKEGANDGNLATGGYVKGAYNAAIKAINKVSEQAAADYATKDGVISTVNKATATVTAAGSVTGGSVNTLTGWGDDTTGSVTVSGLTFTGAAATGTVSVDGYYPTAATDAADRYTSAASGTNGSGSNDEEEEPEEIGGGQG